MKNGLINKLKADIETASAVPDAETKEETRSIFQDQYDKATLDNFLLNQGARKKYSHRIFMITSGWLISVVGILLLVGFKKMILSDAVLIALLGTTTVNVLGFFLIVIQYLFNKEKST
jgi:uncharacterized membrane protein YdbT with pleckstrin-like domain